MAKKAKKHVTIVTSPARPSSVVSPDVPDYRVTIRPDGARAPIKEKQVTPEDGYRTHTFEDRDMERITGELKKQGHHLGMGNNSSQDHLPLTTFGIFGRQSANPSMTSLGDRLREKLQWRERIRHYTWTFFTMTMATGGIANVIHTGMPRLVNPLRIPFADIIVRSALQIPRPGGNRHCILSLEHHTFHY